MTRFILSAIATIIVIAVFAFLWLTNPVYAFIGGVVFVVFMLVGFASWLNSKQREATPEEKKVLDPRRTGEYRRPERVAKPEVEWSDNSAPGGSAVQPEVERSQSPKLQPEPNTSLYPDAPLEAEPEPEPAPQPAPVPVMPPQQKKKTDDRLLDEIGAVGKTLDQYVNITQEQEAEEKPQRRRSEVPVIEEQEIHITPDEHENTDVLNISDENIADLESEIAESESEFTDLSEGTDSGASDGFPEDVKEAVKEAYEKAKKRKDTHDDIDYEDEYDDFDDDEISNWLHTLPTGATEEVPEWLNEESDDTEKGQKTAKFSTSEEEAVEETDEEIMIADSGLNEVAEGELPDWLKETVVESEAESGEEIPDWLMVLEEEKDLLKEEIAETARDDSPVATGSSNFDLMDMIGSLPPDKQQEFYVLLTEVPIGEQTETQLMRLYQELNADDKESKPDNDKKVSEAQFTAYYPRQAAVNTEYGFYVYAHEPDALLESDIQQFEKKLGGRVPKAQVADEKATLEDGATLTVMIHCDALNFNQVGAMQQWKAPFVRFDFNFTANESLLDEIIEGRIAILMGMIEIASINFNLVITPANPLAMITAIPHDPITAPTFDSSATASLYQKIFVSYSRKDTIVAEQYRKIQMMAGNIIFMDTHSIRAGEDWEVALKRFIDEADVFQLFWSQHSASSDHVRFEWEYALTQRCPETRCVQYIRPAYWKKPLPDIPEELNHLHFAFVEMEES